MELHSQPILDEIDRALAKWEEVNRPGYLGDTPTEIATECHALLGATLERLAPPGSHYRESVSEALTRGGDIYSVPLLAGALKALRADYEDGYLQSVHELIHADLFADFLEMADHLLEEGYKDPAAVIAGGVLEEHLRKICEKQGVPTQVENRPKKADGLNSELAGANAYSKLDQKSVTAWLDLRNKAAHAKYAEYAKDQVAMLIQGIRDFISRHPA